MTPWPTHCARCHADFASVASIMSKFNLDTLCLDCKNRERLHPDYAAADAAEVAAVRAGQLNFPGVGNCPPLLYQPPCIAETVALALVGKTFLPTPIVTNHGGVLMENSPAGTLQFAFPDGSCLSVGSGASISRLAILRYPTGEGAGQCLMS
jgi:hypothetical protein